MRQLQEAGPRSMLWVSNAAMLNVFEGDGRAYFSMGFGLLNY